MTVAFTEFWPCASHSCKSFTHNNHIGRYFNYSYFIGEQTEAQRGWITYKGHTAPRIQCEMRGLDGVSFAKVKTLDLILNSIEALNGICTGYWLGLSCIRIIAEPGGSRESDGGYHLAQQRNDGAFGQDS